MNKERKIWFGIMSLSGILYVVTIYFRLFHNVQYAIIIPITEFVIFYTGIIMYGITQYWTTKEFIKAIILKIRTEWS